jgi:hypothetical protein
MHSITITHTSTRDSPRQKKMEDIRKAFASTMGKGEYFASNCNQKKNNYSQSRRRNHPRARCFKRRAPSRAFRIKQELDNSITSISSN